MKHILSLLLLSCYYLSPLRAQTREVVYLLPQDSTQQFYVKRVPAGKVKGVLVLNMNKLSDSAVAFAYHHNILLLGVIPVDDDHYLDNFAGDTILARIDHMITEVVKAYEVPKGHIVIGGMSAAGTGAIRYAQYCAAGRSAGKHQVAGVFAVDPPLDFERFWKQCKRAVSLNFHPAAVAESNMVMTYLNKVLGGDPYRQQRRYQQVSPFCYSAENGGNAYLLDKTAVRVYTEPDVQWWITNRRYDYYGMNAIDAAALVNQLLIDGNERAALITTTGKGYQESGRHPHAWTIVDQLELLQWCLGLFDE